MIPADVQLQILLSEKEHADKQIDSFLDLQMKLLGTTVIALAAAAGWIFSQKAGVEIPPTTVAAACVVASFLLSAALLQTVVTYGIALAYIYYRQSKLAPALAEYCRDSANPLLAGEAWQESPSMPPVMLAAGLLFLLSVSSAAMLALVGIDYAPPEQPALQSAAWVALVVAALVALCLGWNMYAAWKIELSRKVEKWPSGPGNRESGVSG